MQTQEHTQFPSPALSPTDYRERDARASCTVRCRMLSHYFQPKTIPDLSYPYQLARTFRDEMFQVPVAGGACSEGLVAHIDVEVAAVQDNQFFRIKSMTIDIKRLIRSGKRILVFHNHQQGTGANFLNIAYRLMCPKQLK